jgi:hypothetical protein
VSPDAAAAYSLLSAQAVRQRAHLLLAEGLEDRLPHFRIDMSRLDAAIELVRETTLKAYPSLDVPFHSRWRHFVAGGTDLWADAAAKVEWRDRAQRARAEFDLAIVSVLLDAGAGPAWRYRDANGVETGRSEGLALASLALFRDGAFSAKAGEPLRADADALTRLDLAALSRGFQVSPGNPLVGLESRLALLQNLGRTVAASPHAFAMYDAPRPGGLFDRIAATAKDNTIPAPAILQELLLHLSAIWPSRLSLGGVPLHKLSQWLAYSLIEPLQRAGFTVTDIDGLTGLSEYRNGGLFIDTGVLVLRNPQDAARQHDVASTLLVEWRALTVALLDRLAEGLRRKLGLNTGALPLAKVLEGGTWAAGRAIARQRRPDGSPPLQIASDGTVF